MILHPEKKTFLDKCYRVLEKLGEAKNDLFILGKENVKGKVYENDIIYIASDDEKITSEIERKKFKTPIVFVQNGENILFSGDYVFLIDHVESLLNT